MDSFRAVGRIGHVRGALALALIVLAAAVSWSGTDASGRAVTAGQPQSPARLLGISWAHWGSLARFDPLSLRVLPGRRVRLEGAPSGWSYSPDRKKLALGLPGSRVQIVDVRRMRKVNGTVVRRIVGLNVEALAWLRPRRILGVDAAGFFVFDPIARRVVRRPVVRWRPMRLTVTRDALVVLLVNPTSLEPVRLAAVSPEGRVRTVTLSRIPGGTKEPEDDNQLPERWEPALAVGPDGRHAFVIGADSSVAEVDLRSLTVEYHSLNQRVSLAKRFRNWLEPEAAAKGPVAGLRLHAELADGFLAVAGENGSGPAGLRVIDTTNWTARTVEPRATGFVLTGPSLVTFQGALYDPADPKGGIGLKGYSIDGRQLFHLFGDRPIFAVPTVGTRAWVHTGDGSFKAVDTATGAIVAELRGRTPEYFPQLFQGAAQRW
jgi:hypothetical protein